MADVILARDEFVLGGIVGDEEGEDDEEEEEEEGAGKESSVEDLRGAGRDRE
jgi:hypothetical protein